MAVVTITPIRLFPEGFVADRRIGGRLFVQAVTSVKADRPVSSGSLTETVTTTATFSVATTVAASAGVMAVETGLLADADIVVSSRYLGESQTTLPTVFTLTGDVRSQTGTAHLTPVFSLNNAAFRPAAHLFSTWTLTESGDLVTLTGGGGSGVISGQPSDGVDVPFEATTGVRIASEARLTFSVIDFDVNAQERNLLRVSPAMRAPVFVDGRPIHPEIVVTASSHLNLGDPFAKPKPKPIPKSNPPSTGENLGNKTPTHRWLAEDFPFPYGTYGETWPAHGGNGPTFTSAFPYRPKREQYEGTVNYDNVLLFWWHYVEHMWANFNHSPPFTFIITGILHGGTQKQHHHVLDRGNSPTPFFDTPNGATGTVSDGSARNFLHVRQTHIQQASPDVYTGHADLHHKAAIYTASFNGSKSFVDVHMQGYQRKVKGNPGTNSAQTVLLGRENGWVSPYHASHMSLLEVDFFNYDLSGEEHDEIKRHLFAMYDLHKW